MAILSFYFIEHIIRISVYTVTITIFFETVFSSFLNSNHLHIFIYNTRYPLHSHSYLLRMQTKSE